MVRCNRNNQCPFRQRKNVLINLLILSSMILRLMTLRVSLGARIEPRRALYLSTLKPPGQRGLSADQVINRLRPKLAKIRGASLYLQAGQDLVFGGRQGNGQFQYTLSGDKLPELNTWAALLADKLSQLPGIADLSSDQRNHGLQVFVKVDRIRPPRLGITSEQIDQTLYNAFGQSLVSTMYTAMNQYYVVMEVAPKYLATS